MKYNIILHTTTSCNYDCSYCDVIKDNKNISRETFDVIFDFVKLNKDYINRFKFFGGEPLLRFIDIKEVINNTKEFIGNNYEIVTNTTLLNDEIGEYLRDYFSLIFFSIDTENSFNFSNVSSFIKTYNLEKKLYFNLIVSPGKETESLEQFNKLYSLGFRGFNILPVYFTKVWTKQNLSSFSNIMKDILDLGIKDKTLRLYGFTENYGEKTSLVNESLFIDVDKKIYYSDIVSTYLGKGIKDELLLGTIDYIDLSSFNNYDFTNQLNSIKLIENKVNSKVSGQLELHKIMDYFSVYLNKKNGK